MKVVQINATCGIGSTGKICIAISELLTQDGVENYILYSLKKSLYPLGIKCSADLYIKIQALKAKILGNYGLNSKKATKKIIREIERVNPDVVHIHNIHGHDCNIEKLFEYLKEKKVKIIWTFHDCWGFTGYCTHFMMTGCEKWKRSCSNCQQYKAFSWLVDRSNFVFEKKKELFSDLDLTIVTPSKWLATMVERSFLKDNRIITINNGIDLSVFQKSNSEIKNNLGIDENKKIILGVAMGWDSRKGLDIFLELAKRMDSRRYQIVLVGTNEKIDKQLPKNVISIRRTQNQRELAEIYSMADVFVNPTREDTFPTVNIEALACGTPVVTFDTGGSPEIINDTCGCVVNCDDVGALEQQIMEICEQKPYSEASCRKRALHFSNKDKFKEYIELYKEVLDDRASEDRTRYIEGCY